MLFAACACLTLTGTWAAATERAVDLELVLAADISDSMDLEEAARQQPRIHQHPIMRALLMTRLRLALVLMEPTVRFR